METQEVTLHNELKHKSIFLRDFTTAAQMLRQVLRRCFGRCCAGGSTGAAQVLRQLLHRCFDRCFGRCCTGASAGAAQVVRQVLRQVLRPGCERCLACGHRSGVECRDKGNGVAGNKLSISEISILVVRYWAPRECLC